MTGCLFCKFTTGQLPVDPLYQDEETLAFLDIHPCSTGHTLIIPKEHAATLIELSEKAVAALFLTVKRFTDILSKSLKPAGFTIGLNHGPVAGQAVPHVHVHIIPRYQGDNGGSLHTVVQQEPSEPVAVTAKKIRSFIH